ncbi:MAG: tetratricopeptide repeat protein, partial [Desulfobacteraceae bacterium]|nr:tetratricopeptide repeat protein [Desulfobacteraceae bacterium]
AGKKLKLAQTKSERLEIIEQGLSALEDISIKYKDSPVITAKTELEKARLLLEDSGFYLKATDLLNKVIEGRIRKLGDSPLEGGGVVRIRTDGYALGKHPPGPPQGGNLQRLPQEREFAAEAMILKADAFSRTGMTDKVYPIYLKVVRNCQDTAWADKAVKRILELELSEIEESNIHAKIQRLRNLAKENQEELPLLSVGALNTIGDIFFAADDWAKAKGAYRQAIDIHVPEDQKSKILSAAARLSLAEILFREERFRQAIDLYEKEISLRPYEDNIYHLARAGFIRKSVEAGEFQYRFGEVASARKTFKELMEYDDSSIEAHRGYIKCA